MRGVGWVGWSGLILAVTAVAVAERAETSKEGSPAPVVPDVRAEVQPAIERHLREAQARTLQELARGNVIPALFKMPVRVKAIGDPWAGLTDLEKQGLELADIARKGQNSLPDLLDGLARAMGKPAGERTPLPPGNFQSLEDHLGYALKTLDRAGDLREQGLAKLTQKDRQFMFPWPATMLRFFGPQLPFNDQTRPILENDRAFCTFAAERFDWSKLIEAAATLTLLTDERWLASLGKAVESARPVPDAVPGVTGDILLRRETRHGLILIGGKGPNSYDLKVPVALLIDLGGNDHYKGSVAASFDADRSNSVVLDLDGDDLYEGNEFGLATGRLGVGLLFDRQGRDRYHLAPASGGVGLGGIGILCDRGGDDEYRGSKHTQGMAIGGIGLLLDLGGDDRYTSFGQAIGLGGPVGVGAVLDAAGNDSYQCGGKYPSGYNASDSPNAKPGDPSFQYDCFGLAMGLGRRLYPFTKEGDAFALAGGLGIVIDLAGNDRYDSSNFSQACGYYFGVGLKLDLAGDDVHGAARYGHASGAHYGLGLFVDYAGKDVHSSVGPTYNCGCAWDRSVFLFVDAGSGDDQYQLDRSAGLGRADIGSWAVFADLGGKDSYVGSGLGKTSQNSLAVFLDHAGEDDYQRVRAGNEARPANRKTLEDKSGGLFIDR